MPPPAEASHVIFASSSWTLATSAWSFCACFISWPRSGILPLDIGLYLLDLRAEGLEHDLGHRVLARLGLALGPLVGRALAIELEDGTRRRRRRLGGVEQADRDVDRAAVVLAEERAHRVELVLLARHLAEAVVLGREAELDRVRRPRHDARVLVEHEQRHLVLLLQRG